MSLLLLRSRGRSAVIADAIFGAEWRTATGKTSAAFRDSGNRFGGFPSYNGPPDPTTTTAAEIMAGGAWLSQALRGNPFRMNNAGTNNLTVNHNTVLAAAQSHWGRVYFRDTRTTGTHNHWIAQGGLGGPGSGYGPIQWAIGNITVLGVRRVQLFTACLADGTTTTTNGDVRWAPGLVSNPTGYDQLGTGPYLLEWQIEFTTYPAYYVRVWISEVDANGFITAPDVYTNATLLCRDYNAGGGTATLATRQNGAPAFGFNTADSALSSRQYVFGNEGAGGNVTDSGFFEAASFGLSTTGRLRDSLLGLAA